MKGGVRCGRLLEALGRTEGLRLGCLEGGDGLD